METKETATSRNPPVEAHKTEAQSKEGRTVFHKPRFAECSRILQLCDPLLHGRQKISTCLVTNRFGQPFQLLQIKLGLTVLLARFLSHCL